MANSGRRFGQNGGSTKRKVIVSGVPTKEFNNRKVVVSTKDLTLDARFTIASQLRQQTASRQSHGRDKLLAQKRGVASAEKPSKRQVQAEGESQKGGRKGRSKKARTILGGVRVRPTAVPVPPKSKSKRRKRGGKKSSSKMQE
ncbi:hypothetical protein COCSUDRAFT_67154 [Coccomyxa subellipsoidea C-169]|uniref:Uncharacterized protein n=1 Tax=Coccomyxa subellipsoidea (strain C-169) TaxID=574566 RepID=I0YSB9_COCSC|nr:hypothetical protein COCSUDRAFT_67154 [Coccomyxa subellipsoidea C-169]EIE21288.1 hypothetical protein COCSUDRAFT_67154 [Coccomyxa subellipsoidea C-169]|eukprot:XP_005645832.1 hypothetical protein COCSUDRAFT_67154 [Coccomyxa subellipsoidea C-169]